MILSQQLGILVAGVRIHASHLEEQRLNSTLSCPVELGFLPQRQLYHVWLVSHLPIVCSSFPACRLFAGRKSAQLQRQYYRADCSDRGGTRRYHGEPSNATLSVRDDPPTPKTAEFKFRSRGRPNRSVGALFDNLVQFRFCPSSHFGHRDLPLLNLTG